MTIELIEITPTYMPLKSGKYLIKTISTGPLKTIDLFAARVSLHFDEKKNKWSYSIDVSNQIVTHISLYPIL